MFAKGSIGDWKKLGPHAWLALIFLQPFNHFGALRILATLILVACLVAELIGDRTHPRAHPGARTISNLAAPRIAALLALWAIAVSLLGPYPLDSFHALRKDLLTQAALLIATLLYVRASTDLWRPVGAALAGFATVTLGSLAEVAQLWWRNEFVLLGVRSHGSFWGGYASTASFYIPLLFGTLLASPLPRRLKIAGYALLALATVLMFLYGSRTPLPVILLSSLLLLVLLRQWRGLAVAALLAAALALAIQWAPAESMNRYRSLLEGKTYVTNSGLSSRLSLWEGVAQVVAERPLTGYGYGWKKLAWAINDGGFGERWVKERPDIAVYLREGKASYGNINPHNYFLQVMLEVGSVGLLLALAFWGVVVRDGIRALRTSERPDRRLAACLLAAIGAYALANLTNGQWVGGMANVALVLAAGLIAMARRDPAAPR